MEDGGPAGGQCLERNISKQEMTAAAAAAGAVRYGIDGGKRSMRNDVAT